MLACLLVSLSGCSSAATSSSGAETALAPQETKEDEIVKIEEKRFVTKINGIYIDSKDYIGKTLQYEGFFNIATDELAGETVYSVIRYGPGCCGTDGNPGFEVWLEGEVPKQGDWVEVTGILGEYPKDGYLCLFLAVEEIRVLSRRGAEYVFE